MANAQATLNTPHSPEHVWALIGGFDSLPDWLPFIPESLSSEGGRVRSLKDPDGNSIVERLMAFDEQQRSYSYSILTSPFPVTGYLSTLRVKADGQGSRVEWFGEFTPVGVSDEEATALFTGIYEGGLQALAKSLG
ncbi:SRPBCC family protein [Pseudomonas sp. BW16M2]|uniref:SRPBCC family protein n=1 Tax=Pseudomonas peradeniyensis TaxID=2745488 RepID=A0ABT2V6L7_9PSED|nr:MULTISPECIES: SRPBCC family protein [Pseudomonas]MBC3435760.1 SRPBCC family protein [Pseudomonas sp. BW16M2]MCU7237344.1 SRPBCC family protein [Pseudomonas peradeniyensis]MCU7278716.1 SRPBCC family protein [Pseudomonas peradeniyensis]